MPKKPAEPETPPADAPRPDVWEENGEWFHRDETESVYGPFPTKEAAAWGLKEYLHDLEGWRPPVLPALEAKMREIWAAQAEVANLEETYKNAKARLKVMEEHELTELVTERELNDGVHFDDGREFTFERKLFVSLPEANKPDGFRYLNESGAGHIIKRSLILRLGNDSEVLARDLAKSVRRLLPQYEVSLRIGKAPSALVEALKQLITDMGLEIEVEQKEELPGASLRSYIVKQQKLGQPLPAAFEVYAPMMAIAAASKSPVVQDGLESARTE